MPQIATKLRKICLECGYIMSSEYLTIDKQGHVNLTHPITSLTAKFSCGSTQDSNQHKWKDYEQTIRVCAEPDPAKRRFRGGKSRQAGQMSADHVSPTSAPQKERLSKAQKKKKSLENKRKKYN